MRAGYPHTGTYLLTGIIALVAAVSGILMILTWTGLATSDLVTPDPVGGLILILITLILSIGIYEGREDRASWVGFAFVGTLLASLFAICTVIIGLAGACNSILGEEEADIMPIIGSGFFWAGLLAIPAFYRIRRILFTCSAPEKQT